MVEYGKRGADASALQKTDAPEGAGRSRLRGMVGSARGYAAQAARVAADHGTRGSGGSLPHGAAIQASFGRHSVANISAHVGGAAAEASEAMGASAFARGNDVAFASSPDLHTAAHEAAHVVQQRAGVSLYGGVGQAGDRYERHADRVADLVVRGEAAESTLDELARGAAGPAAPVGAPIQRKISFKQGNTFTDLDHLREALHAKWDPAHHAAVDQLVLDAARAGGRAMGALHVYKQVMEIGQARGWTPAMAPQASEGHGPHLPRLDAHGTAEDKAQAMSTFMFGSVTLARAEIQLPSGEVIPFEGRNAGPSAHAEDVLIGAIEQHLASSDLDPSRCRLRLTINNLPCGPREKNCAGTVAAYAEKWAGLHVYYMTNYGADPVLAIQAMQAAGVEVSQFSPKDLTLDEGDFKQGTWKKIQAHDRLPPATGLDDWSGDEMQ